MAARVATSPAFTVLSISPLFSDPLLRGVDWKYDVTANGLFVSINEVDGTGPVAPSIHVFEDGYEGFRDRECLTDRAERT